MIEQIKSIKMRWPLAIVLGLIFVVSPVFYLVLGITAALVTGILLLILLGVAWTFVTLMRKKVAKPMLGRNVTKMRVYVGAAAIVVIVIAISLFSSIAGPSIHDGLAQHGSLVFAISTLAFVFVGWRWQREANYWFEQNKKLQQELDELKRTSRPGEGV